MEELEARARRARRRTVVIVLGGLVAGAVLGWGLPHTEASIRGLQAVGWALAVAGLGGTFSLVVTTTGLASHLRVPLQSLRPRDSRFLRRSVDSVQLIAPADSEMAQRAFDYARITLVYQPLALAQFLLLYAGLLGPQLADLFDHDGFDLTFSRVFCSTIVIVAVIFAVVWTRKIRGARGYVRAIERQRTTV
ncbi:hypothetical protein DEJ28_06715 [Curtobacterium sp. MCPF17_002]|uniref:hypothetical protein n=1 Tax=Curtobacterium sp. MCPF17_002 TaxID=2175645 RepID=UPI000DA7F028|nr:hypothetical protein [Curtobacterium sp. MCPF17_002]WIB78782.1 hypothetical protein DEJ28_06715 [Curtobacterium sp. MCPF17_002]